MTSLTTLAQAAAPAPPAFNSTFYSTIATVIPVLFIAYVLQGPYQQLLRSALGAARAQAAGQSPWQPIGRTATWIVARLPPSTDLRMRLAGAFLVLTAGFIGEASAIYALYQGRGDTSTHLGVLIATIILLLAVINGPTLAYMRILLVLRHPPPQAAASPDPPEPGAGQAEA
jgi:hypothetical protein